MIWDLVISIGRIAAIPVLLLCSLYAMLLGQVWGQKSAKARLELVDPADHQDKFGKAAEHNEWAEGRGFEWLGAYVYVAPFNPKIFITCWRRAADDVIAACYAMGGKQIFDFVSMYEGEVGLTTCTNSGAMLYPPMPGAYKQAFTQGDLDLVLQKHLEGDDYLRRRFNLRKATPEPIERVFVRSVAKTARHAWRIWFFPLRSLYWYTQLRKRSNIPVSMQDLLPPEGSTGVGPRSI